MSARPTHDEDLDRELDETALAQTAVTPPQPRFSVVGDVYCMSWPEGIDAELDRLGEHRGEITGELTVRSRRTLRPGLLHSAKFNIQSSQTRRTVVQSLARREPDVEWARLIEELCFLVRERYREGEPATDMRTYEAPTVVKRWGVEPFIERAGTSVLFGEGGVAKGWLAEAIAVTRATGIPIVGQLHGDAASVMYLDYEDELETFGLNLRAVCAGAGIRQVPPIYYRRMVASLNESASVIRKDLARTGAQLVIVDSAAPARGGDPNDAEATIKMYNTARSFGVPTLFIDHVSNEAARGGDPKKPIGSSYSHNLARLTWSVERKQQEDEDAVVVALTHRKANHGRRMSSLGYRIEFENDANDSPLAVRFRRADLAEAYPEKAGLAQRILAELRMGPRPAKDLPEALEEKPNAVRARLSDLERRGRIVRLPDGTVALKAVER